MQETSTVKSQLNKKIFQVKLRQLTRITQVLSTLCLLLQIKKILYTYLDTYQQQLKRAQLFGVVKKALQHVLHSFVL